MPSSKKRTALEEAEWEDEGQDGALDREIMLQCMEPMTATRLYRLTNGVGFTAMQTLRVYRPRIVLHGLAGMGQSYVGTAALHHLEGYNIQNLDLGTLLGDSTRVSSVYRRMCDFGKTFITDCRGCHCSTIC